MERKFNAGGAKLTGNATVAQVLAGRTFYNTDSKAKHTGEMVNNGGKSVAATASYSSPNIRMKVPENAYYSTGSYLTSAATDFGDAKVGEVLARKTFTSSAGLKKTGTLANKGEYGTATKAGFANDYLYLSKFAKGYYHANGTSWGPEIRYAATNFGDAVAADVLTGKTFTSGGTKKVAGAGSMPNNGTVSGTVSPYGTYTIPKGYHSGSGKVTGNAPTVKSVSINGNKSGVISEGGITVDGTYTSAVLDTTDNKRKMYFNVGATLKAGISVKLEVKIQGSNNNSTWTDVKTASYTNYSGTVTISGDSSAYRYYRAQFIATNGASFGWGMLFTAY